MDQVPPLFAHALRYVPGDAVRTPFGSGTVAASSSTRCDLYAAPKGGGLPD